MSFIDITDLPKPLAEAAARGNIFELFDMIYSDYSRATPDEHGDPPENNQTNANTIYIHRVPARYITIEMMDGTPLVFKTFPTSLQAYPENVIELETGSTPDTIYLAQIGKSPTLSGTKAVNYAMETAAALGAHWLTIWDAATVYCDENKNGNNLPNDADPSTKKYRNLHIRSMPLSIYRAIISDNENVNNSWYTTIAKRKSFKVNRTKHNRYKFKKALDTLSNLNLSELRDFAETCKTALEEDVVASIVYFSYVTSYGEIRSEKRDLDTDESVRQPIINYCNTLMEMIDEHENSKVAKNTTKTLKEFLKDTGTSCYQKGFILRLFAGYSIDIEIPHILYDQDGNEITRMPAIEESLLLHDIGNHPIINLSRRGGKRRRQTCRLRDNVKH